MPQTNRAATFQFSHQTELEAIFAVFLTLLLFAHLSYMLLFVSIWPLHIFEKHA